MKSRGGRRPKRAAEARAGKVRGRGRSASDRGAELKRSVVGGPVLRARVWVEAGGGAAMTEAAADLLEQIEATGSLSEAARRLRFSYRRAWLLVDMVNRRWDGPLVRTATGGMRGGGSRLTELGSVVLRWYRDVQIQVEAQLDQAAGPFREATRGGQ